jgi:hypothetical protein
MSNLKKQATHETLNCDPIKKFIISQFKNINFKNLSKKKNNKKSLEQTRQPTKINKSNMTYDMKLECPYK